MEDSKLELLTVSQVARELGMSVDWMRKAAKRGTIRPAKRHSCGWRLYSPDDVIVLKHLLLSEDREIQR